MLSNSLYLYGWVWSLYGSPTLNLAFTDQTCSEFCKKLTEIHSSTSETYRLRRIPNGSPHHLDNKSEILGEAVEKQELDFFEMDIVETPNTLLALYDPPNLHLEISLTLKSCLIDVLEHSQRAGYMHENYLICEILTSQSNVDFGQRIYFWSCEGKDIIYY